MYTFCRFQQFSAASTEKTTISTDILQVGLFIFN